MGSGYLLPLQSCRAVIKFNCPIKQLLQLLCVAGVPQSRLNKLAKLAHGGFWVLFFAAFFLPEKHKICGLK